jgi:alanine dehydrogenase
MLDLYVAQAIYKKYRAYNDHMLATRT